MNRIDDLIEKYKKIVNMPRGKTIPFIVEEEIVKDLEQLKEVKEETIEETKHSCGSIDPNATSCDICGIKFKTKAWSTFNY